jgi:hypothetical protein
MNEINKLIWPSTSGIGMINQAQWDQTVKVAMETKNAEGATGPVPAAPQDRRVTWLGSLLRRTHIDELPQMINIAKGEMSLVGPRPERTIFVERHLQSIRDYARRHSVRPGLAGMAQVYGDYYSTPRQKLHYDLLYIRRRSFGLDLQLFMTAVTIGLFGIRPNRRHAVRRTARLAEGARWAEAYSALRGGGPPDAAVGTGAEAAQSSPSGAAAQAGGELAAASSAYAASREDKA